MPFRFRLILSALLCLGTCGVRAGDLPWTMLIPAHDSRDAEMRRFDETDLRYQIQVLNRSGKFEGNRFVFSKIPITGLLGAMTPFADLPFDSVRPMEFTPEEKTILKEWLKRGGFLVAFEDTYPYEQEDFRRKRVLPAFDFFIKDLPAEDPDFTVDRAGPTHAVFREPFPTKPAPPFEVEIRENPNYRGFTYLVYKGRMVVFFMGRYSYMENGRWVRVSRPFPDAHDLVLESYSLILNVYFYALTH